MKLSGRICRNCGEITFISSDMAPFAVAPLSGKYYGTAILFGDAVIGRVWKHDGNPRPSQRELEYSGFKSHEEFFEACCDSHWESAENYQEALDLVERLNALHV